MGWESGWQGLLGAQGAGSGVGAEGWKWGRDGVEGAASLQGGPREPVFLAASSAPWCPQSRCRIPAKRGPGGRAGPAPGPSRLGGLEGGALWIKEPLLTDSGFPKPHQNPVMSSVIFLLLMGDSDFHGG